MALFQVHLSRVTSLLDDLKTTVDMFQFVVSWKNPLLTLVSLYFFLHLVFVFDPIYIGSFPVFLGILWMIYLAIRRSYGKLNQKFIQKEIEASRKVCTQLQLILILWPSCQLISIFRILLDPKYNSGLLNSSTNWSASRELGFWKEYEVTRVRSPGQCRMQSLLGSNTIHVFEKEGQDYNAG